MENFEVVALPAEDLIYTNKAILNPSANLAQFEHISVRPDLKKVENFVFSVKSDPRLPPGKIAFNATARKWASLMTQSVIQALPYQFELQSQCLNTITFEVDFNTKTPSSPELDTEEMSKQFSQTYYNQAFMLGQLILFAFHPNNSRKLVLQLKVKDLEAVKIEKSDADTSRVEIGLTTPNTIYMFEKAPNSDIKLVGQLTGEISAPKLFSQNWDFETMGVGGLGEQFNKIFRRAFASRLLPPKFAQKIGSEHVRGILLYGPPGTGKTLIARQIGKMLLSREPKIVNGPEVLNKYVGESEANIRKLFQEAEEEQAKSGIYSGLHMIIFDEIDALCKQRGSTAGSAGVGDNVVNQLLSKIDGVNALHNVLLVGMTNRKDLIDEALLRPGRFEVQIEIGLPNKQGRLEILKIHTSKIRAEGVMDDNPVLLAALAEDTRNYTGAEIAGLVKAATSLSYNRVVKIDSKELTQEMLDTIKVTREDFDHAMKFDIKPALGASEDQLKSLVKPMIDWIPEMTSIRYELSEIVQIVGRTGAKETNPYFVLIKGGPGSGTTTIAANMAAQTNFPFIRVYEARFTDDKTESAKVQYLKALFSDASRSELSCVVINDLDSIFNYSHIGPRFSDTSRQVFMNSKQIPLPEGRRMLVICTCNSEQALADMRVSDVFDATIRVPSLIRAEHVNTVLTKLYELKEPQTTFTPDLREELVEALRSTPFKMGIKRLERINSDAETVHREDKVSFFLRRMQASGVLDVRHESFAI